MKRFYIHALLLAFALGIASEWFCFPILDGDNQSNIFLGLKSIDYPEAYCLWFHSWPDRLLGEYANHSDFFPDLPQSPAFHAVAMLQWALLYYLLFLVLRFFYHQTNPRIAPEGWRTPRRFARFASRWQTLCVLDCGGPPPL
jgi:hypothetical protein